MSVSSKIRCSSWSESFTDLSSLSKLFATCFGPSGRLKIISADEHCDRTISTTSSTRLLEFIIHASDEPVRRLVLEAVKSQQGLRSDGGLTVGCLCLDFIRYYPKEIHTKLNECVLDWCLEHSVHYLSPQGGFNYFFSPIHKPFSVKPDLMNSVVMSCIYPKLVKFYSGQEIKNIANECVKAFILTLGQNVDDSIRYKQVRASYSDVCRLWRGVLLDSMHLSSITALVGRVSVSTVFVTVTLDGNTERPDELGSVERAFGSISYEEIVFGIIENLVDGLRKLGVTLLACQKVLHPRVKMMLRARNMHYLERLGLTARKALLNLTGGTAIQSLSEVPTRKHVCFIRGIEEVEVNGETFARLYGEDSSPCATIILAHWNEEGFLEAQTSFRAAIHVLATLMTKPFLLPGAGVWQRAVVQTIREKERSVSLEWMSKRGLTRNSMHEIVERVFCRALERQSEILAERALCVGGGREDVDYEVLDSLPVVLHALSVSVSVAKAVVSLGNVIIL